MQNLSNRINSLSAVKKRLLDIRLKRSEAVPVIERREGQQVRPLSFSQRRLWFAQQLDANSSAYNIYGAVRLRGHLDVESLQRSLNEIVRRHEVLRTRFATQNGEAVQVIGPPRQFGVTTVDLAALQSAKREQQMRRLAFQEADTPFDLESDWLFRVKLVRLTAEEHVLLITMHHIISDGWSLGVLGRELVAFYEAYRHGREAGLPELPIQYGDYAEWQRRYLSGGVLDQQLGYWPKRFGGELPVLELPAKRARSVERRFQGSQY